MDGNIYFFDLEDGTRTREPINLGMNFTCSGALDPRGYPLLYLGASDGENKTPRIYVISLIDGKVLYEQSGSDIDAYYRQFAFNSAPLISAETDTLIWPCESGILYFIKLNTQYTKETGTISVKPENTVKLRYKSDLYAKVGTASSPIAVDHYLYFADNAGMVFCVDLTTMDLVWAQSTGDQVSSTPVFERTANGEAYLYTATAAVNDRTSCHIHKLDARTGEIVWKYTVQNVKSGTSLVGGVLATPLLGKPNTTLDGMLILNIARTPTSNSGALIALDTATGSLIWENDLEAFSWSSPIALYTSEGTGYIVSCDSLGNVALYEAATGNLLDSQNTEIGIEASPAAFENTIVIGTSEEKVFGFDVG
jgi:outer membrane protein assembly factor BamB